MASIHKWEGFAADRHIHEGPVLRLIDPKRYQEFLSRQRREVMGRCGSMNPEDIESCLARGGFRGLERALREMGPEQVVEEVKRAGLRDRTAEGPSTAARWETYRRVPPLTPVVVSTRMEGFAEAWMERKLLEEDPFALIEGLTITAYALGAEAGGIVEIPSAYQPLAFRRMSRALKAARARRLLGRHILGTSYSFDLEIRETEGQGLRTPESASLICSACARSIFDLEGPGKDEVSKRPEWPAPFYMNNVETYLNIPLILAKGAAWFSQVGDRNAPGTKIFALTGKTSHPCLIEAPIGSTLNDLLGMADGDDPGLTGELKAFQMGGPAGGIFPSSFRTTPMDFDSLAHIGWKMGSGYIVLLDEKICTVEMARYSLGQVIGQACERCHPCLQALRNILAILSRLCQGLGEDGDLETLEVLAGHIRSRGRCNLALAGALPVETSLRYFRDEYEAHLKRRCPARFCRDLAQADPAFRLAA
ncbi:MAG: NADH-quinone oxidoreductase subunit F [Deltaproteobacteria bacterium]|nr:NADH-quinone oxidoreductase subunit F [Deltaproteobacteria bacterium]